ncbi:MAG: hypothetical protein OQK71_08205 [Desulfobacter sp.]|jgi:hypothetical protein|uniref:hypothetical protein n=1 Tax=uncultured Desulfobacter sp. TaxID=240139 RepID=UPI0029C732EB|nr:hypothetical protein [uncultured Desulfobacter sp.]MCW8800890.1 hypothetical protein [Desulfobacter sp.]
MKPPELFKNGQGIGAHIRQSNHLKDPRYVGIPRLSLDAGRQVQRHARTFSLDYAGHELF